MILKSLNITHTKENLLERLMREVISTQTRSMTTNLNLELQLLEVNLPKMSFTQLVMRKRRDRTLLKCTTRPMETSDLVNKETENTTGLSRKLIISSGMERRSFSTGLLCHFIARDMMATSPKPSSSRRQLRITKLLLKINWERLKTWVKANLPLMKSILLE